MADGSTKAIEDVEVGDRVVATDPLTGQTVPKTVTAEIKGEGLKHLVKITVHNSDGTSAEIVATEGHPFWVAGLQEWIDAAALQPGQWL